MPIKSSGLGPVRGESKDVDEPTFIEESRGGWDSPERWVTVGLILPDGTELQAADQLVVERDGERFGVNLDWFTPEFEDIVLVNLDQEFEAALTEAELREAWGDWVFAE